MKASFGIKLGLLLMVLTTVLVGGILINFNQYSTTMLQSGLKQAISDVTRTASMVFQERDREIIQSLRAQLYHNLPDDYIEKVAKFSAKKGKSNRITELLPKTDSKMLEKTNEFQHIVQLLRRIQAGSRAQINALKPLSQSNVTDDNASRVAWAYLMVTVPNVSADKTLMFLADSNYEIDNVSPDGNPIGNLYDSGGFFIKPFTGQMGTSAGWYEDLFGRVMTAVVPIKNSSGEVIASLGVDYNVNVFTDRIAKQLADSWKVFAIAVLSVIVISVFITTWVSVPLAKLRNGAEQLSQQDFEHVISIRSHDEFGVLAKTMNGVSQTLGEFTRNLDGIVKKRTQELLHAKEEVVLLNQKLKQENAHLGAEVDSLIALRKRMMPEIDTLTAHQGYEVSFHYLPTQSVAGDFWQIIQNNDQQLELVIGQVSGYGLETAMTTMQVQSLLAMNKVAVEPRFTIVNHYLHKLNESINLKLFTKALNVKLEDDQVTISGQLEEPILYSNSDVNWFKINEQNLPLGLQYDLHVTSKETILSADQNILLYTSGFVSALLKLKSIESNSNLSAQDIINMADLVNISSAELVQRFKSQVWFDDFEEDICFITIKKRQS